MALNNILESINFTLPEDDTHNGILNPFNLSPQIWMLVVVIKALGEVILDPLILFVVQLLRIPKMPSRTPPIMKGLQTLETKDYLFLLVNQGIEAIFVMNWSHMMLFDANVQRSTLNFTISNTIVAFYTIFLLDDFLYYFAHRIMHMPLFYPWCHKHHHRQSMPRRGYFDAANESPLEQVLGLLCVWVSMYVVKQTIGEVHVATGFAFLLVYACMAFLNHTEYDVKFGLLGLGYSVRAHEMHHRFPTCNYAQNTMCWDKMLGTFLEYKGKKVHEG